MSPARASGSTRDVTVQLPNRFTSSSSIARTGCGSRSARSRTRLSSGRLPTRCQPSGSDCGRGSPPENLKGESGSTCGSSPGRAHDSRMSSIPTHPTTRSLLCDRNETTTPNVLSGATARIDSAA